MVRRVAGYTGAVAGLLLIAFGAFLLVRHQVQPQAHRPLPSPSAIVSDAPFASATPSPGPASPAPRSHDGMRVRVPALGIDLGIVEGDGWNAPYNLAARYPSLAWPGDGGRSMIYAHAQPGMFEALFKAAVGQKVEISRPGAPVLRYTIVEYYPRWPSSDPKWLQPLSQEELILETCTTYNPNDPRIIAVAHPDS